MVDSGGNVNDEVIDEWTDETTPFERVRTVMKRTYEPHSAAEIAKQARTTATTARKHLEQLVESGFVEETAEPGREATLFNRSKESLILEQARDILAGTDQDALVSQVNEMREQITTFRDRFDGDSPEDVVVQEADIDPGTLREWQTIRRNLGIAKAALALAEAEETIQQTQTG